jgi:brefeldin A-resistance guanine nucleotide exchange factor 1
MGGGGNWEVEVESFFDESENWVVLSLPSSVVETVETVKEGAGTGWAAKPASRAGDIMPATFGPDSRRGGTYVVQGEMTMVVSCMRRNARWSAVEDDVQDPLLQGFAVLKQTLATINGAQHSPSPPSLPHHLPILQPSLLHQKYLGSTFCPRFSLQRRA